MILDPDFERAASAPFDPVDWINGDAAELRRAYNKYCAEFSNDVAVDCRISNLSVKGLQGLLFTPKRVHGPQAIVYFHGGSWVVGSPDTHRVHCSHLATATGLPVISARYGLAPEHKYPRQSEDGVRAVEAVLSGAAKGVEPKGVFLAGDSAGAALAFWTDDALPERQAVRGVLGFYGAYGDIPDQSAETPEGGLSPNEIRAAYERLGELDQLAQTPGFNIITDIPATGAPTYLSVGTADPLTDNTARLAARLREIGRPVTVGLYAGLGHSYLRYVERAPKARQALDDAAQWIKQQATA